MVTSDNIEYKSKIMDRILNTPDIVTLLNNIDINSSQPFALKNVNVFSRIIIPNTALTVKNYICFNFNSRVNPSNNTLKNINFDVVIVCHENEIKTDWGNRHDVIAGVITDSFAWSDFLGFELEQISDIESIWEKEYSVRTLQFKNLSTNSLSNGVKIDGY